MKKVLLWLWQLPQNLIGFILTRSYLASIENKCNDSSLVWVYYKKSFFKSGISLGNYIILDRTYISYAGLDNTINHEHGHQKQSLYLGPLYLIVIGLPSIFGNILRRLFVFDYYKLPWEAWADKLGGVKR